MFPLVIGIITTFKCPLNCEHCCFKCGPQRTEEIDITGVTEVISRLSQFSHLRCVAFTGGEPLLLGKKLNRMLEFTSGKDLNTRVVTSAYWGNSPSRREKIISDLKASGLNELNISTGDCHGDFVPLETVCQVGYMAAMADLRTLIVVEHYKNAKINKERIEKKLLQLFGKKRSKYPVIVMENEIIPREELTFCLNSTPEKRSSEEEAERCDNILLNMSFLPDGNVYACCGLTMLHIPELHLGTIDEFCRIRSEGDLQDILFRNFLWLWLSVEGPKKLARLVEDEIGVKIIDKSMRHRCHQCLALFSNKLSRPILHQKAESVKDRIILAFLQKQHFHTEVRI